MDRYAPHGELEGLGWMGTGGHTGGAGVDCGGRGRAGVDRVVTVVHYIKHLVPCSL